MAIVNFKILDFSDKIKYVKINDYILSTWGNNSYCVSGVIQYEADNLGRPKCHLAVGNYVSMAQVENFYLALNHDYTCVTTSPLFKFFNEITSGINNMLISRYQTIIGNDVWIGNDCTILEGVYIGNGAVVGAHSVVTKDVPPYAIVAGNPARIVKYRFSEEIISKMQKIKWWYWPKNKMKEALPYMDNPTKFVNKYYRSEEVPNKSSEIHIFLHNFRVTGKKIYCLPIGDSQDMVEYKIFIKNYIIKKNVDDNIMMLLLIEPDFEDIVVKKEIEYLVNIKGEKTPELYCYNMSDDENMYDVLSNIDYLITTNTAWSMKCLDYATEYNVIHCYIMDQDVLE